MSKFIYSFAIVFTGLLLGYVVQILVRCRRIDLGISIGELLLVLYHCHAGGGLAGADDDHQLDIN
ncbi:MAG: hypothetical protein GY850_35395 [bacterium]|nr:hypothetical protein [bacterium]